MFFFLWIVVPGHTKYSLSVFSLVGEHKKPARGLIFYCAFTICRLSYGLVQQEGFADVLDLRDRAFEVEGFGEDYLEYLMGGLDWLSW